ncbi:uncharacterized protein EDB93DRAFT_1256316 [Suillus bovinus]|uniref:uncharacterized protein n=1 Tax=Suillus bovinus TaxID=48563 RepID=UPI001B85DDB9|nr:uncharacterized protein EDB93DRAFT_1256316 [Suillus bovinus]KAG2129254.1 hypothetical protein EDB93DRAFT_1256316 [Suillus bovinus]
MACIAGQTLSTILNSSATSTLIMNCEFFWSFNENASVLVKTANHGTLQMSGRGNCVAELTIDDKCQQIQLSDCLHALGALINLMSIGRMLKKGWECNFDSEEDPVSTSLPLTPAPSASPAPAPSTPTVPDDPRHSLCSWVLTKAGQAYADKHEQLASLCEACAGYAHENTVSEGVPPDLLEGVSFSQEDELMENIKANTNVPNNKKRNPHTPDYDMSIPPATYDEAMKQLDST